MSELATNQSAWLDSTVREAIAEMAYSSWDADGRPEGRFPEHWTSAETIILAALQQKGRKEKNDGKR